MTEYRVIDHRVEGDGHPIDLTREEFIHFQVLLARVAGPMRTRTLSLIISLSLAAALLAGEGVYWYQGEKPDLFVAAAALLLAGLSLLLWWYVPYVTKRNAGRLYDRVVQGGGTHYGLLRLYPLRVEKAKASLVAKVTISPECLYIEDEMLQVFMDRQRQAIVLPGRCMTPELAEQARQLAAALPPQNCKFFGRVIPQGLRVTPPAAEPLRAVFLEEEICYTPEEHVSISKALTVQMFWKRAPLLSLLSGLCALMLGWGSESASLWMIPLYFLLALGVLTLLNLVLPLRRIPAAVEAMSGVERSLRLRVDERGLYSYKTGYGESYLPWSDIKNVYDAGTAVEFSGKNITFTLPKRCIPDLAAFTAAVDEKMAEKRNNSV